jgi:hypothetical protein
MTGEILKRETEKNENLVYICPYCFPQDKRDPLPQSKMYSDLVCPDHLQSFLEKYGFTMEEYFQYIKDLENVGK